MEARACAWLVMLGFESAALSLGPAKKDEESAKIPWSALEAARNPTRRGSHEADASTGNWGGQSRDLLRPKSRIKLAQDREKIRGTKRETDAANAATLYL